MNGSWDASLASPADFVGADDLITKLNLEKEREPGIEILEGNAVSTTKLFNLFLPDISSFQFTFYA